MRVIKGIILLSLIVLSSCTSTKKSTDSDINYSFIVMGCNRISWNDDENGWKTSKYFNEAHTNINQLYATFDDVLKLSPLPNYFFFVGDLVLAEVKDTTKLVNQLTAWKKVYKKHPISKSSVRMVAVPGNHEFLYSEPPEYNEVPNQYANEIWLRLMSDYIVGDNGPNVGGPDSLLKDESKLTYSITHKGDHFIMMNTDTYDQPGKVPVNWIVNDMKNWRSSNEDGHLFLFGHKPAYDSLGLAKGSASDPGLAWNSEQITLLWNTMNETRAEAMFSSHEHLFWAGVPEGSKSWQVIAGNAGTTLQSGDYFGFTEVQMLKNGSVKALSHGRPVPTPDYGALIDSTTVRATFDLTWPKK